MPISTHWVHDGEWYKPKMRNCIERCCKCGAAHRVNYAITTDARNVPRVLVQVFSIE